MIKYDYIIVGAGASGLMTAFRMAKDPYFANKSILILDKEKKTDNDRTWCFWEQASGEWDDILNYSWSNIQFSSNFYSSKENITPYKYKMIRSEDFYQKIWKSLANKSNITFIQEPVTKIFQEKELAKVVTSQNIYFSKNIINSILFSDDYKKQTKYPVLQQHFVGFFIKTKENYFDNSTVTFMDFTVEQRGNTRFMYILPYKKNEALFEYTLFSADLLPYDEYKTEIEKYLLEKGITEYEIVEKEQGSIPMTCYEFWKSNSKNILHIGTAGGWSKASTGYTFKNIDKKTVQLINHLKQEKSLNTFHKKTNFWFYDLLLLDILAENNHLGAAVFAKMFKNVSPQKIFKFLDEETSIFEDLKIFVKMQKRLFSKALFKRIF
ncbi:lycopene cyclase family protein [Polaribacter sp. Hel_I_88]|uniref:lycopene cyclase family protein n=1 Tax=Polaribacter sp. Hel_I_88 TaxID=1250006 RepID=UPI00047A4013|nr:lycopene cyclase family protein [Polaribacter sp. Hel_I_88]